MEGAGKSALFEALMGGFPFNYTGIDRATVAPISYTFKKNMELRKLRWRVHIKYSPLPPNTRTLTSVNKKVRGYRG